MERPGDQENVKFMRQSKNYYFLYCTIIFFFLIYNNKFTDRLYRSKIIAQSFLFFSIEFEEKFQLLARSKREKKKKKDLGRGFIHVSTKQGGEQRAEGER